MPNTRGKVITMKLSLWVLLGLGVTGLAFWFVTSPWSPRNAFVQDLIVMFFMAPSVGAFWMLYVAIRHERHPAPFIFLAFIPFTFLWYYFARVRPREHEQRQVT